MKNYCYNCGGKLPENINNCPNCGSFVDNKKNETKKHKFPIWAIILIIFFDLCILAGIVGYDEENFINNDTTKASTTTTTTTTTETSTSTTKLIDVKKIISSYSNIYLDNDIYIVLDEIEENNRILENDIITIYAIYKGTKTYTTVLGAKNTLQKFEVVYYDIK